MNNDLPPVVPMSAPLYVIEEQAREVLIGLEPGWYTVRDLYPRYLAWAEREKVNPATKIQYGMTMRRITEASGSSGPNVFGHVRLYGVTEEMTAAPADCRAVIVPEMPPVT